MKERRFLFREEYLKLSRSFSDATQRLAILDATVKYGLSGEDSKFEDQLLTSIFELIKIIISKDLEDDEIFVNFFWNTVPK